MPALALGRSPVEVVDPRAGQERALDRPAVRHALQVALELAAIELWLHHAPPIVPDRAAAAQGSPPHDPDRPYGVVAMRSSAGGSTAAPVSDGLM